MPKSFNVTVHTYAPYKREYSYREVASDFAIAIKRAVRKFRGETGIARKRIKQVWVAANC